MNKSTNDGNQSFESALKLACETRISDADRLLFLLTETVRPQPEEEQPFYSYTDFDGRLVFPMGQNQQGQRQFLVSINPRLSHYPFHPQPEVMKGWHWTLYGEVNPNSKEPEKEQKPQQIVIVLTALEPVEEDNGNKKAMIPRQVPTPSNPLPGFSLASLGVFEGRKQYVIVIDSDIFRVQLSQN